MRHLLYLVVGGGFLAAIAAAAICVAFTIATCLHAIGWMSLPGTGLILSYFLGRFLIGDD